MPGAAHDAAERHPPPKCHHQTRTELISDITSWLGNTKRHKNALWLHGPAGAGKSAIAQTIAERCREAGTPVASFFFSRHSPGRDSARYLVNTLAYQIAVSFPEVGSIIEQVVASDPSVLTKSLDVQLSTLIIEPLLRTVTPLSESSVRVVIIDGLDECTDPLMQKEVIGLVHKLLGHNSCPICVVVASRRESTICEAFESPDIRAQTRSLSLEGSYQADNDIKAFLSHGFAKIYEKHHTMQSVPEPWPTQDDVNILVTRSSGQFIYAATVLKFVDDESYQPDSRLDIVLGANPISIHATTFLGIDQLYLEILSRLSNVPRTLCVLGVYMAIISLPDYWTLMSIDWEQLVEDILHLNPKEVRLSLRGLQSLLRIPDSVDYRSQAIQFFHASFSDFLVDSHRAGPFFVDKAQWHSNITRYCLDKMIAERNSDTSLAYIKCLYSSSKWCAHCAQSSPNEELLQTLLQFDIYTWLVDDFRGKYTPRIAHLPSTTPERFYEVEDVLLWLLNLVSTYAPLPLLISTYSVLQPSSKLQKAVHLYLSKAIGQFYCLLLAELYEWDYKHKVFSLLNPSLHSVASDREQQLAHRLVVVTRLLDEPSAAVAQQQYSTLNFPSRILLDFFTNQILSGSYYRFLTWEPIHFLAETKHYRQPLKSVFQKFQWRFGSKSTRIDSNSDEGVGEDHPSRY